MKAIKKWQRAAAVLGALTLALTACGGTDATTGSEEPAAGTDTDTDAGTDTDTDAGTDTDTDTDTGDGGESAAGADWCDDTDVTESIVVGINNPNYATQLAVVLADEKGYFAEQGITDVEIIETDEYIAGLIGGSLTIAQGDTDVTFGSADASGEDLVYLGTYRNGEYQIMGTAPGIENPEDLIGQPVTGGDLEGRNTSLMRKFLQELGVDPDEVEFVPMGGNSDARLQAVMQGTVKAASLFPRHKVPLEEAGGKFMYEEFEVNPQEGVIVMGDTLENDCATVIAYMTADLMARRDMYDFSLKDEHLEIMRSRGFEIPDFFEEVYQIEVEQVGETAGFDVAEMDELVQEMIELGELPEGLDWRQYVDLRPLHTAQEALGIEPEPASLD
ncbi:ABC transporter substrate-binding protein [Egicoccus sp. AB-alg6-2]|uniref:ABC transporter substrate-binding protein n=1 Tax=Egicoccus sp. AB-alg6-2 TaxID=3242692 RepID=UPI00359E4124